MKFSSAGIVGLGYVGLPLAGLLVAHGIRVVGVDVDTSKILKLQSGISYISDMNDEEVNGMTAGGQFEATTEYARLASVEAIIICVPTPIDEHGEPDLSFVKLAGAALERLQLTGQLIVLESSTYPGTTEEVLLPILQKNGKRVGEDFYLAYSPERINPGDKRFPMTEMPKIVSGVTEACLQRVSALYSPLFREVIPVSSPRAAEMAKVMENSQRFINISFMNELAKFCERMNINIWEIIYAVNSKPYGNLYFYPGSGVGGHCIPVDPLYLQWKAAAIGSDLEFIKVAKKVNDSMPGYVVSRLEQIFADCTVKEKSVLVVGVAYKKDVNDIRESSAMRVMSLLVKLGAAVSYHDPLVPSVTLNGRVYTSVELSDQLIQSVDCVLILMDHSQLPLEKILANARLVFDTKHAAAGFGKLEHVRNL